MTTLLTAQDLTKHQWKERVVLIVTNSFNSNALKEQLTDFKKQSEGLVERKIVVYQITPQYYRKEGKMDDVELGTSTLFQKFQLKDANFTMILMGLDGSIKKTFSQPQESQKLFDIIDMMPMRQQELEKS